MYLLLMTSVIDILTWHGYEDVLRVFRRFPPLFTRSPLMLPENDLELVKAWEPFT
jgi:hypothetical protein